MKFGCDSILLRVYIIMYNYNYGYNYVKSTYPG